MQIAGIAIAAYRSCSGLSPSTEVNSPCSGQVWLIDRRRELGPRGRSPLAGWAVVGIGQSLTGAGVLAKRPDVVVAELVFGAPMRRGTLGRTAAGPLSERPPPWCVTALVLVTRLDSLLLVRWSSTSTPYSLLAAGRSCVP